MRIAICPGSFDPVTKGHVDILERSSKLFDKVIAVVMVNPNKTPTFTKDERVEFIKKATRHIPNIEVDSYLGLVADYAREKNAHTLIKGLRAVTDFEYEFQQALTNKKLFRRSCLRNARPNCIFCTKCSRLTSFSSQRFAALVFYQALNCSRNRNQEVLVISTVIAKMIKTQALTLLSRYCIRGLRSFSAKLPAHQANTEKILKVNTINVSPMINI